MAKLTENGTVIARCPGCAGALATFEFLRKGDHAFGVIEGESTNTRRGYSAVVRYILMKCGGCGRGALLVAASHNGYPGGAREIREFYAESGESLRIPTAVPMGITREFREAESCLAHKNLRAASGMFRSVLDKTLRASGYKLKNGTTLEQQIDLAAADGVLTEARRRRAHDEVRVLGNDVLHDEWREISPEDVEAAQHYTQRILEDFYDDRASTLKVLREKGRVPQEDSAPSAG